MSQVAEDVLDASSSQQKHKRYEESVMRNYIASEQAKSFLNYASNQCEMMNVTKEYAALIQLCSRLIQKEFDITGIKNDKKCLFIRYHDKKRKVMCGSYKELVSEAKDIVGGEVTLSYLECEHEIALEREKDFDVITEFTVVDCELADEENTM